MPISSKVANFEVFPWMLMEDKGQPKLCFAPITQSAYSLHITYWHTVTWSLVSAPVSGVTLSSVYRKNFLQFAPLVPGWCWHISCARALELPVRDKHNIINWQCTKWMNHISHKDFISSQTKCLQVHWYGNTRLDFELCGYKNTLQWILEGKWGDYTFAGFICVRFLLALRIWWQRV